MNDFNFVFTTGAPGSAWSMISRRFKKSFRDFDCTDDTPERQYQLPEEHKSQYTINGNKDEWKATTHIGSYFGPYHEFGDKFDKLTHYSNVNDFYQECLMPFSDDTSPRKLIKSHWFAYNLDWLWENCKGHDLMLVYREPEFAKSWWYQMGGWNIKHPVYTWYKDDDRMWSQIQEESKLIWEFGQSKGVEWLDWDHEDSWLETKFGRKRRREVSANPNLKDIIKIGYLKIE